MRPRSLILAAIVCIVGGGLIVMGGWLLREWRGSPPSFVADLAGEHFQAVDCKEFFDRTGRVTCGWLRAPRDHFDPTGTGLFYLPVVVFHPRQANHRAILIPGGGGPGNSLGFAWVDDAYDLLYGSVELLEAGFAVVMVEERGVGWAVPDGTCDEYLELIGPLWRRDWSIEQEQWRYVDAAEACRLRQQRDGIEPRHWALQQSASDMALLMSTLPFDRWAMVATSHATVVALATADLEPPGLDRLVLDSPVDIASDPPVTYEQMQAVIKRTLSYCSVDPTCGQRFPDLEQRFDAVVALAAAQPGRLELKYWDVNADAAMVDAVIDKWRLLEILFQSNYWPDQIAALPALVQSLERQDTARLRTHAAGWLSWFADPEFSDAYANTVTCGFYLPRQNAYLQQHPAFMRNASKTSQVMFDGSQLLCDRWQAPLSPLTNRDLLDTRLPVLMLAGGLDPVTPAAASEQLQQRLSNATLWLDPLAGHSVASYSPCARDRIVSFLLASAGAECPPDVKIEWLLD